MKNFQEKYKTAYFAIFLGVTAVLVTAIAYVGFYITNPIIEQNNIDRINNNIALLFSKEDGFFPNEELDSPSKYQIKAYKYITDVYEVLNEDGDVQAVIYNVWAQGKGGAVNALVAIDPYTDTIVSVIYYKHGETPNIGEKHTRESYENPDGTIAGIEPLLGQQLIDNEEVFVEEIAGATITWGAIKDIFDYVTEHYFEEEVHIDG